MTVAQRILAHITLGAGVVIAVTSAVTYAIVYEAAKQRDLQHLQTYVAERARREEAGFRRIEANLETVAGQFIKRNVNPVPANYRKLWDERFERFPDGAWRSRREFADGYKYSTLWMHRDCVLTPELQTRILRGQDICDELLPTWGKSFPSLYFDFPEQANVGFDPTIPQWVWETPPDYDLNGQEWVKMAFPAENPGRKVTWTGVLEEEITRTPQVGVVMPIYQGDKFLGSVAHSISVAGMIDGATQGYLEDVSQMIFRADGRLIAHPGLKRQIIDSKGKLTAQTSGDAALAHLHELVAAHNEKLFSGYDEDGRFYYTASRLAGPEWFFVTVMPKALLQKQAFASAKWVLYSGLFSLALVLVIFTAILRRQVVRPLAEFARATNEVSAGNTAARAEVTGDDELGRLAVAFNDMVGKLDARGKELSTLNQTLEERVAERTKKLRESEERFGKAFQASPALIALTRLSDGTFVAVNEAFCKISGYREDEVIGRGALDLKIYDQPGQRDEYVREIREQGRVRDREHRLRTKDGSLLTVLTSGESFELDGVPHLLTVGLDITARKQAEGETLRALDREKELGKLKGSFISMVSHEFRTPLGVIQSAADVLDRYFERLTPEKRREHLQMIFRSTRGLSHLVDSVLMLGRVEDGRMKFVSTPVDLEHTCRQLADELRSASSGKCPIELEIGPDLEGAMSDHDLLRHILSNLLSNAVKYSEAGTPVSFSVARENGNAVLKVTDRGIGIPEADRAALFTSFARGSNVGQLPGSGLGLLIVKRCVDLHGGTLHVDSEVGRGTTVTVTLPVFQSEATDTL